MYDTFIFSTRSGPVVGPTQPSILSTKFGPVLGPTQLSIFSTRSGPVFGAYPAFYSQGAGIKRPDVKLATHFHLKQVKIKNEWSHTSTPTHTFTALTGTTLDFTLCRFKLQGVATADEGTEQQAAFVTPPLALRPQMCRQHISTSLTDHCWNYNWRTEIFTCAKGNMCVCVCVCVRACACVCVCVV